MRLFFLPLLSLILILAHLVLGSVQALPSPKDPITEAVKQAAFQVLQTKCNVCHKRQNPFKVFSLKNMEKHAPKIHQQVFVLKRMPRGDAPKLTETESAALLRWLRMVQQKQDQSAMTLSGFPTPSSTRLRKPRYNSPIRGVQLRATC